VTTTRMERNPNVLLEDHLRARARSAGLGWDTYDPAFCLGVIVKWLGEHDAVLTSRGVEKE
jgi:hypothetical protein